ncbi:MAG: hypothetical protein ACPGXX_16750, partial [Planctomycetaceae bacterium]
MVLTLNRKPFFRGNLTVLAQGSSHISAAATHNNRTLTHSEFPISFTMQSDCRSLGVGKESSPWNSMLAIPSGFISRPFLDPKRSFRKDLFTCSTIVKRPSVSF